MMFRKERKDNKLERKVEKEKESQDMKESGKKLDRRMGATRE